MKKKKGTLNFNISNTDRSIGAGISGYIAEKFGEEGLPKKLSLKFNGSADKVLDAGTLIICILF